MKQLLIAVPHSDASCFIAFPSVPQKASFVLLPANYKANDVSILRTNAISVPLTRAAVRCGGDANHSPALSILTVQDAHKQGEDVLYHSMLLRRFMTGSPEDRLEMLEASSLFRNFVLIVSESVDSLCLLFH